MQRLRDLPDLTVACDAFAQANAGKESAGRADWDFARRCAAPFRIVLVSRALLKPGETGRIFRCFDPRRSADGDPTQPLSIDVREDNLAKLASGEQRLSAEQVAFAFGLGREF